jgi:hypothetical protein
MNNNIKTIIELWDLYSKDYDKKYNKAKAKHKREQKKWVEDHKDEERYDSIYPFMFVYDNKSVEDFLDWCVKYNKKVK